MEVLEGPTGVKFEYSPDFVGPVTISDQNNEVKVGIADILQIAAEWKRYQKIQRLKQEPWMKFLENA